MASEESKDRNGDCDAYLAGIGIADAASLGKIAFGVGRHDVTFGQQTDRTIDSYLNTTGRDPLASWTAEGPCTLVCIDPDAPDRAGDGSGPGKAGPWLHWIVTDATRSTGHGTTVVKWNGPTPPKGNHRYILLLFQQSGAVDIDCVGVTRKAWDAAGFITANASVLKPVAMHFFYCKA